MAGPPPVCEHCAGTGLQLADTPIHIVPLPYVRPPLSLNDGDGNPHAIRTAKRVVRRDVGWVLKAAKLGAHQHVVAGLVWRPAKVRVRDTDNTFATGKPVFDAMVDAGIVPDDDPAHMTKLVARIVPPEPGKPGAVWLTVQVIN